MAKGTPEQVAQDDVELTAPALGCTLLRNNSGALQNQEGAWIRFGLGNISKKHNKQSKSSDLIGITPVTITPEMVGKTVGVFTAIEVKPQGFKPKAEYNPNSREWAQENFNRMVRNKFGFSGFATSGDDLKAIIQHYIEWLKQ
ncbi:hypothetical protein B8b_012 [Pseudoalteromonas phage B8b]|uniref:VRR-NUC domain-containing protein n=1 Tax=Pseudoalteromonas phage B8b TaxID=1506997 RepID=A0A076G6E5_9CAUD|nr:hypothetical protein B8b_012 [Pseudoalteromonas phage B8b]